MAKRKLKKEHASHPRKFAHYLLSEVVALAIDLALLSVFVSHFHMNYIVAAAIAYIIAVTVHYHSARKHVFHGTVRDPFHAYTYFLGVGFFGLAITLVLVSLGVHELHFDYLLGRTFAALAVIPGTYILNCWLTFIMPRPLPQQKDLYCNIAR